MLCFISHQVILMDCITSDLILNHLKWHEKGLSINKPMLIDTMHNSYFFYLVCPHCLWKPLARMHTDPCQYHSFTQRSGLSGDLKSIKGVMEGQKRKGSGI